MPKNFWAEAANQAVYILNRCPTAALTEMRPEESWSGKKPSVTHFKVFGCIAHTHVPDVKRKKLDAMSEKYVFLGTSEESKVYRLYNPTRKKIVVSRDVVFSEEERWDWTDSADRKGKKQVVEEHVEAGSDSDTDTKQVVASVPMNRDQPETSTTGAARGITSNTTEDQPQGRVRRPPAYFLSV